MTRQSPPSRAQKDGAVLEAILGTVLDAKNFGGGAPERTSTFCATDEVFLVVDGAENNVATHACEKGDDGLGRRERDGVTG